MLKGLYKIVVQIQFSYHFKVQSSMVYLGIKTSQNTSHRKTKCEKHKLPIISNFPGFRRFHYNMSRVTRKPDFCLCENKGADQLRSNCTADQRLCFRYTDSTLSLLIKSEISSFYAASGTVHVGLCQTWLETPKTGFLASRLNYCIRNFVS